MVVDYRKVKSKIVFVSYPMPTIEEALYLIANLFRKSSCDIARKLSIFQPRVVDVHFDDQLDPCQFSRDAQLFPYGRSVCLLYMQQLGTL